MVTARRCNRRDGRGPTWVGVRDSGMERLVSAARRCDIIVGAMIIPALVWETNAVRLSGVPAKHRQSRSQGRRERATENEVT
jgi:hypothetical protein